MDDALRRPLDQRTEPADIGPDGMSATSDGTDSGRGCLDGGRGRSGGGDGGGAAGAAPAPALVFARLRILNMCPQFVHLTVTPPGLSRLSSSSYSVWHFSQRTSMKSLGFAGTLP